MTRKGINVALFQAAWFAAVLGAAGGMLWLGPVAMIPTLAIHLALQEHRRGEVKLLLVAGVLGFLFDTAFVAGGVFTPLQHLFPRPCSPPWMVCLWLNFAATLNVSMAWLRGRYLLAAAFGAVGGPLAYYSGARMGATESLPTLKGMLVLALGWGVMTPVLVWLAWAIASAKKTPE
ncbi:MAG: DUF2878 domain-containing protein [Desulfuromonadales bacterium]|nr:DUF2878 domain-containing protein [Desulfuromonadales bacterium]